LQVIFVFGKKIIITSILFMIVFGVCLDILPDTSVNCQKNFFFSDKMNICVPNCQTWSQYDESTTVALRVTEIASTAVGILLAIVAIVFSIIRYRSM